MKKVLLILIVVGGIAFLEPRSRTQIMKLVRPATEPIRAEARRTHKFCKLAGTTATRQIHLKETILSMYKSQRSSYIVARISNNCGHTQIVALDSHRSGEAGQDQLAFELGKAAAEPDIEPGPGGDESQKHQSQDRSHYPCDGSDNRRPRCSGRIVGR